MRPNSSIGLYKKPPVTQGTYMVVRNDNDMFQLAHYDGFVWRDTSGDEIKVDYWSPVEFWP